jgi:hypothetical protein
MAGEVTAAPDRIQLAVAVEIAGCDPYRIKPVTVTLWRPRCAAFLSMEDEHHQTQDNH